jgi:hypothetical protein
MEVEGVAGFGSVDGDEGDVSAYLLVMDGHAYGRLGGREG